MPILVKCILILWTPILTAVLLMPVFPVHVWANHTVRSYTARVWLCRLRKTARSSPLSIFPRFQAVDASGPFSRRTRQQPALNPVAASANSTANPGRYWPNRTIHGICHRTEHQLRYSTVCLFSLSSNPLNIHIDPC